MPLTDQVTFKVQLQNQNRLQVPRIVRWQYKIEPSQIMKVNLRVHELVFSESFLAKMLPDGRIPVPRFVIVLLQQSTDNLKSFFLEVTLEPVG